METIMQYDDYCVIVDDTVELAEKIVERYDDLGNKEGVLGMIETLINSLEVDKLNHFKEAYAEHLEFLDNDKE